MKKIFFYLHVKNLIEFILSFKKKELNNLKCKKLFD